MQIKTLGERGARSSTCADAEQAYDQALQKSMHGTVWTAGQCQSWYLDDTGRNPTLWPTWSWKYRRETRRFDKPALGPRAK